MYLSKCSLFGISRPLIGWRFGLLVFGRRGNHAKDRAEIGVGQRFVVQSQADYFTVQQLELRAATSPSASSAPLKGVLHHPKHRAIDFIDITSE